MPDDASQLSITLRYPESAFVYRATKPRLQVDGADMEVPGWGEHTIRTHAVDVWVPYAFPRRAGRAHAEVAVSPGEHLRLEYMAPTVSYARGALGEPGQVRSAGLSVVRMLNVVAVLAVLVGLIVVFIPR